MLKVAFLIGLTSNALSFLFCVASRRALAVLSDTKRTRRGRLAPNVEARPPCPDGTLAGSALSNRAAPDSARY